MTTEEALNRTLDALIELHKYVIKLEERVSLLEAGVIPLEAAGTPESQGLEARTIDPGTIDPGTKGEASLRSTMPSILGITKAKP